MQAACGADRSDGRSRWAHVVHSAHARFGNYAPQQLVLHGEPCRVSGNRRTRVHKCAEGGPKLVSAVPVAVPEERQHVRVLAERLMVHVPRKGFSAEVRKRAVHRTVHREEERLVLIRLEALNI